VATTIGEALRRREDNRLVAGAGRYADDLRFEQLAHVAFARSPHAHARLVSLDSSGAAAAEGVLAVLTGADLVAAGVGPIPHSIGSSTTGSDVSLANRDGSERARTPYLALPTDRVRFVGEAYAAVIAETAALARDAAELVEAEWEELAAVTQAMDAAHDSAPLLWDHVPGNLALEAVIGDAEATAAAFESAAHIVRLEAQVQRVTGVHMEPRGAVAEFDAASDLHTLHASSGIGVVAMREQVAATLVVPLDKVRVVAPPDVGGNFGTRNALYPEWIVLMHAARLLGRPVKHIADRTEAFLSDFQGRDLHVEAELALDADGRFLAFRSTNTANLGAHTVSYVPLNKGAQLMTSLYRVPIASVTARAVLTNTPPTIPYRSAGRPEAMFGIERLIDISARELGFDRIELRRRNMAWPAGEPLRNPLGVTYDNGDYVGVMDQALHMADWSGFEARRTEAAGRGRLRGIGFSNYIEGTGGIPRERAEITVDGEAGTVDVIIGTQDTGQGHATAFAQLIGALLGVDADRVRLRTGDTDFVKAGGGTHSGRSLRFSSIVFQLAANEILAAAGRVLASRFGCAEQAVAFADGYFRIPGSNEAPTLFEAARSAGGPLHAVADVVTPGLAFPYGAATCEIEIDPETGAWEIERYVSVDDVGRALNPMIVDGQTHGGIVQGAGQALMEGVRFDAGSGQALTASMMDYAMPRADDFPSFVTEISEVPSVNHPMGFRPGGEGGTTPALGLVVNAIVDALAPLGITDIAMPATPARIWNAIQAAKGEQA
jgi:carbon-monoxide dehydrogenase large subunit